MKSRGWSANAYGYEFYGRWSRFLAPALLEFAPLMTAGTFLTVRWRTGFTRLGDRKTDARLPDYNPLVYLLITTTVALASALDADLPSCLS